MRSAETCVRIRIELPDNLVGIYMPDDDRPAIAETLVALKPNEHLQVLSRARFNALWREATQ